MKDEEAVGPLPAPTAPVAVFWDLENCHVPNSVEAAELVGHIFTALRQRGLSGVIHIQAYADTSILPVEVNSGLSSTGVHLLHVARGRKEASDKAILVDMVLWALDHPPPAHFLLISGDRDFSNVLHRLKFRQYNIMLATTLSAKPSLVNAASLVWDWAGLARGDQLDPVPKAKRQSVLSPPPSGERRPQYSQKETRGYNQGEGSRQGGSSTGWGDEEPRNSQTEASRGEEMDSPAARGGESQGRGVSSAVREMLSTIVKGHPDGCSVGEVMQALRTHGFKINWVGMGFPNLLALLKALPDVCLVDEDVRTKEGFKLTRIYPARQSAGSSRRSSGALAEEPETNANYGQGHNNQTQPSHTNQSSQGQYNQSPSVQYNQKPPVQYNQTPPVQYNQTPPVQYNQAPPVQYSQGSPLLHTPEPAFSGPRPNGAVSPRPYDPRPPVAPPSTYGQARGPAPPAHYYQNPPRPSFSEARAEPRGPAPPRYQGPPSSAAPPPVAPGEFRTLVAVVWELQRQAGGQPPDQRQVISMLRNEHGELFASLGGYGPYETPFKYIEAAQRAGYLDIRAGPAPGSVALALTPKAGEHAYDFPQNPPQQAIQPSPPPRMPYSNPPSNPTPAQPIRPTVQVPPPEPPRSAPEPRVVVSADPPEAEPLMVPLPPVLLKGTAASLRRDLMAPTEANIRARVVQLMRPQSVMAGGTEVKQWFVPDGVWEAAVKAAIAEGALVPSTLASREVLLPQGMPSWRFVDPHYTMTYPAQQWAALEDCLRTAKGRAVIEGSYTRYAAARGMLQAGGPALKELALGQMINMLQAAVKKGWILPGPSWRPARVTLTPAPAPQQGVLPSPSSGSSDAAPSSFKSPSAAKAASSTAAAAAGAKKKEYPPWLVKLRQWLPLFLQQIGAKGFKLAALKGTFRNASGIDISEADLKEAGFLKFSQMLAAMPDVCTLHTVIYHGTNTDYVLYPPGWTPPPKGASTEALSTPPTAAAVRSASPGVPVATFFPKEVDKGAAEGAKAAPAVDRETVKRDMAQLLAELLPKYPDGVNAGGIKILYANRFGYQLDHEAVGYPKLRDLLQALPSSCRLTFHPYIMIHARTATPAKDSLPQDGKPDRKVWSPVKKSATTRAAAVEGHTLGVKPAVAAENRDKDGDASEGEDGETVGPIGCLSLLPGAELSLPEASTIQTELARKAPGEDPSSEVVQTEAQVPVSAEVLETTTPPAEQPSATLGMAHEKVDLSKAAADLMHAVGATIETAGHAKAVESHSLSVGTYGQQSPEVAIPVGLAVGATPEPTKALNWSPDSLATPVAATPDRKLVLPHEATAYSVKPAELRSRLAQEVHAIQEETEPAADDSPEESPVSVDSVAAAPSEDAHFEQQNGASSGQNGSGAGHVAVSEVAKLLNVTGVSDESASADGGSDADSGSAAVSSLQ